MYVYICGERERFCMLNFYTYEIEENNHSFLCSIGHTVVISGAEIATMNSHIMTFWELNAAFVLV